MTNGKNERLGCRWLGRIIYEPEEHQIILWQYRRCVRLGTYMRIDYYSKVHQFPDNRPCRQRVSILLDLGLPTQTRAKKVENRKKANVFVLFSPPPQRVGGWVEVPKSASDDSFLPVVYLFNFYYSVGNNWILHFLRVRVQPKHTRLTVIQYSASVLHDSTAFICTCMLQISPDCYDGSSTVH